MPSSQAAMGTSPGTTGGDQEMGNTSDQTGPARAPASQGVAGATHKAMPTGAQPIPSIAKNPALTAPTASKIPTTLPYKGPAIASGANEYAGYANVHEWVAAKGSQQIPRGPSQMQGMSRPPQSLSKATTSAPMPAQATVRPGQNTYQWSSTVTINPKPEPHRPSMTLHSTEALSLACQSRGHNPEWIPEKAKSGVSYSVRANGKVYRANGVYPGDREAKTATASVALASLGVKPWAKNGLEVSELKARPGGSNLPAEFKAWGGDIFYTPSNPNKISAKAGAPAPSMNKTHSDPKAVGITKQDELKSILKRLQAIFGSGLKDRSRDPPETTAAFLEGLSIGSRIVTGNMNSQPGSLRSKENAHPRRYHAPTDRGVDRKKPAARTRSRSPSREARPRQYRERERESSQTAYIKQEVLSPQAARGNAASHDARPAGRGNGFPADRKWDHDGYVQRYAKA
ncbi:hypothetical protein QBC34DRAFT_24573 [Podospora aff. communis PSN243]|uniref:DRBM domain-containing protein n=1 Tax=Podospora aff. communis PSN243 TaxID=3040156 RepID=A0AAV9G2D3_9PEZI|nr:hypothetical protein QBC34DRAFT_24573 [Podospora aff. communis PSN243]